MKVIFKNILPFILLTILFVTAYSQNNSKKRNHPNKQNEQSLEIRTQDNASINKNEHLVNAVKKIQNAISDRDVESLSSHLSSRTYLNLPNGISGYYSANQAYFVLEDFLKTYRITSFSFDEINTNSNTPYATGAYDYNFKGNRNSAHIYLQLRNTGNNWRITQITIN